MPKIAVFYVRYCLESVSIKNSLPDGRGGDVDCLCKRLFLVLAAAALILFAASAGAESVLAYGAFAANGERLITG